MGIVYATAACFALFLIAERLLLWHARKQFALVIHVNGTRGKSTVTRMIHAMLLCQGMEAYGKTTGSAARLLLPDGSEKPVLRLGPANIREQRNTLIKCALKGHQAFSKSRSNKALILECNAVQAELQHISMRWLRPDITVITNVREDHVHELGTAEQSAQIFASAIPDNSTLVTSEKHFIETWQAAAQRKNLRLVFVDPRNTNAVMFPENAACVLGAAQCLGIDYEKAIAAATSYRPDAGAFAVYSWKQGHGTVVFADARAANDIESTNRLWADAQRMIQPNARRLLLLINREDRPDRCELFMHYIKKQHREFDECLCLGHTPLPFRSAMKREGINIKIVRRIEDVEQVIAGQPSFIFAVGNYGGKGKLVTKWIEGRERHEC